ncbi:MAG: branched-chain amino acid transaminase [Candidatus Caldarchaeum sp.]|nr:branched-chain amino acid transaminase [Candidatus Caldarchaeum sp.]
MKAVWMDGELVPWEQAKVHVSVNALHYGSAVFEGCRGYYHNNEIYLFRLREHLKRLVDSARIIMLNNPYTVDQLQQAVVRTVRENGYNSNIYVRPVIYAGENIMSLNASELPVHAFIIVFQFDKFFTKQGLRVCVSSWRRLPDTSMPPRAKSSANYLNSILASTEARKAGYDEAILLDQSGFVSEGAGENIFLVKDGVINTPSTSSAILEGITRDAVITLATDMGYKVVERPITRTELYTADELFFTGTAVEILPILEVDGRTVGDGSAGPVTKQLTEKYFRVVRGQEPNYRRWLTPVYGRA